MAEADEFAPGGRYETSEDVAHDTTGAVECPECGHDWIPSRDGPCPGCGARWEDIEAAADFLLEQLDR